MKEEDKVNIWWMREDPLYFCEEILDLELSEAQKIALLFWSRKLPVK